MALKYSFRRIINETKGVIFLRTIMYFFSSVFRFYLGHWQEGIGKLFSFGGLGVWTLVDVVMVAIRYIGPADGSLYI